MQSKELSKLTQLTIIKVIKIDDIIPKFGKKVCALTKMTKIDNNRQFLKNKIFLSSLTCVFVSICVIFQRFYLH